MTQVSVTLGILGTFKVKAIKDPSGRKFLHVSRAGGSGLSANDQERAAVFERLLVEDHPLFKDA